MKKIPFILLFFCCVDAYALQYGRDVAQMMSLQATANSVSNVANVDATPLPIPVSDPALEQDIRTGKSAVTMADLEKCRMIYPNGTFSWGIPDVGEIGTTPVCMAEVYMKSAPEGGQPGTPNDKLLAIAHIPAGASIKCNISQFPQAGYQPDAGTVTFPADNPPTVEDVEAVMNKEQKNNVVAKAVTAALVGGAGMYLATKDSGDGKKTALMTAAGAVGAGGLSVASSNAGKIAGDTIMSAGVNAAAGAVVGNMASGVSGGDSVLVVKDCTIGDTKTTCLWGYINAGGNAESNLFYNPKTNEIMRLKPVVAANNPKDTGVPPEPVSTPPASDGIAAKKDESKPNAPKYEIGNAYYKVKIGTKNVSDVKDWAVEYKDSRACFDKVGSEYTLRDAKADCGSQEFWVQNASAMHGGTVRLAMMVGYPNKLTGSTMQDYKDFIKAANPKPTIVGRNPDGSANNGEKFSDVVVDFNDVSNFTPLEINASDGEAIDFNNKARLKDTAIGAGSGAAIGALSSYQNAKTEIQQRWLVEQENYEGSLKNFYCITGKRYLGHYNEAISIPAAKK